MSVSDAFNAIDPGVGFITINDLKRGLTENFELTLPHSELSLSFTEIDSDKNGLIMFAEFDAFFRMDFAQRVEELEQEKERMITQYDIFDHLLKVLR